MIRSLLLALIVCLYTAASAAKEPAIVKPRALRQGDTVALVAPARPVDDEKIATITKGLEEKGYKVKQFGRLTKPWGYLSDTDAHRADAVMDAWRDPKVTAVFCLTGGYGTTRMIDRLDYDFIRDHPKIITGFSDITGLLNAIHVKTGVVTFHSPTTSWVYSGDVASRPFATKSFWNTIPAEAAEKRIAEGTTIVYTNDDFSSPTEMLSPGVARGRLVGGNLSLVHALMGTPYEIQTDGCILFLEDVREEPYRIDRMLSTLRLAGKLDHVSGVVLGLFAGCETDEPERSFLLEDVFQQYFADKPYPVMKNFPVGHVEENATLPIGVMAEMDADKGTLRFLEEPTRLQ